MRSTPGASSPFLSKSTIRSVTAGGGESGRQDSLISRLSTARLSTTPPRSAICSRTCWLMAVRCVFSVLRWRTVRPLRSKDWRSRRNWRVGNFAMLISRSLVKLPSVPAGQAEHAGPGVYQGNVGVSCVRRVIPDAQQSLTGLSTRAARVPGGQVGIAVLSRPELGERRVDCQSRLDHDFGQ